MSETETGTGATHAEVPLSWATTTATDEVEESQRGFYVCGFHAADKRAVEWAAKADEAPPPPLVMLHLTYVAGATVEQAGATADTIVALFNQFFPTISLPIEEESTSEEESKDA